MKKIVVDDRKNSYTTLAASSKGHYEHLGSRFFAYAFPVTLVEEVQERRGTLSKSHPKARHIVEAYRLKNGLYRADDDGEPTGSSGLPVLGQIDSFALLDVAILVVRYFGGTLLGVPGLIKAYKFSSCRALEAASFVEKDYVKRFTVSCPYPQVNRLMLSLKETEGKIEAQNIAIDSVLEVALPIKNIPFFQGRVRDLLEKKIITIKEKT